MPLAEVITLLKQSIGLDVDSVGVESIKRLVSERLRVNELHEVSEYANLLRHSGSEMQSLIEAVVIPETFFFRHPEGIDAFQQIVRQALPISSEKIRVLSIPCSTGEEPYSLAMSLLELGLAQEDFQVDASDVSERVLHVARAGLFGNHSFRGTGPNFRARYFQETNAGAQLQQRVLDCVRFAQGNVVAENFRLGSELYQFIFCRNLLIYFDAETQGQALRRLEKTFEPGRIAVCRSSRSGFTHQPRLRFREAAHGVCLSTTRAHGFSEAEPAAVLPTPGNDRPWSPIGARRSRENGRGNARNGKSGFAAGASRAAGRSGPPDRSG